MVREGPSLGHVDTCLAVSRREHDSTPPSAFHSRRPAHALRGLCQGRREPVWVQVGSGPNHWPLRRGLEGPWWPYHVLCPPGHRRRHWDTEPSFRGRCASSGSDRRVDMGLSISVSVPMNTAVSPHVLGQLVGLRGVL